MSAQSSDTPILDLLGRMTADSMETSSLDEQTLMLVRVAALVAVDAPPASYLLNLGAAGEVGVTSDQVLGVLAAVAPIVGTTRIVAAAGRMVKALGAAIELAELAEYARRRLASGRQPTETGEPGRRSARGLGLLQLLCELVGVRVDLLRHVVVDRLDVGCDLVGHVRRVDDD